jgi:hypothetical protein
MDQRKLRDMRQYSKALDVAEAVAEMHKGYEEKTLEFLANRDAQRNETLLQFLGGKAASAQAQASSVFEHTPTPFYLSPPDYPPQGTIPEYWNEFVEGTLAFQNDVEALECMCDLILALTESINQRWPQNLYQVEHHNWVEVVQETRFDLTVAANGSWQDGSSYSAHPPCSPINWVAAPWMSDMPYWKQAKESGVVELPLLTVLDLPSVAPYESVNVDTGAEQWPDSETADELCLNTYLLRFFLDKMPSDVATDTLSCFNLIQAVKDAFLASSTDLFLSCADVALGNLKFQLWKGLPHCAEWPSGVDESPVSLESVIEWLDNNPHIKSRFVWWVKGHGWVAFDSWRHDKEPQTPWYANCPWAMFVELVDAYVVANDPAQTNVNQVPDNLQCCGTPSCCCCSPECGGASSCSDGAWNVVTCAQFYEELPPTTLLSLEDATRLFMSLVVQTLRVELLGLVPWSLNDWTIDCETGQVGPLYEGKALSELFDGRALFAQRPECKSAESAAYIVYPDDDEFVPVPNDPSMIGCEAEGYPVALRLESRPWDTDWDEEWELGNVTESAYCLPLPGADAYDFLLDNGMLYESQLLTIGALIEWARGLTHFFGALTPENSLYHWGYCGAPPAARMIEGTTAGDDPPMSPHPGWGAPLGKHHFTAGCQGTVSFIRSILRSVNIPVGLMQHNECTPGQRGGHAAAWFPTEGKYLVHGDDPYDGVLRGVNIPGTEFLVGVSTYEEWFTDPPCSDNVVSPAPTTLPNRLKELVAFYLPPALYHIYCSMPGWEGGHQAVAEYLEQRYTAEQLDMPIFGINGDLTFWQHFENKYFVMVAAVIEMMAGTEEEDEKTPEAKFCEIMEGWIPGSPSDAVCEEYPVLCELLALLPP